jgi:hypothetical protein
MSKKVVIGNHEIPIVTLEELPDMLGIRPGDTVEIVTPQFTRTPGDPPSACPPIDWNALRDMDSQTLRELGLRLWCDSYDDDWPHQGKELWLLPGEWYRHIPAGYSIVDINGCEEAFVPGETDNDIRFGCLPYGILTPETLTNKREEK